MSASPAESTRRAAASVLCDLLQQVAGLLRADPDFCGPGVEILTEDKGDLDTEISQRIASLGLCVTVMFSAASDAKASMAGPVFGLAAFTVEVAENALINRGAGGRCCLETAELAARLLHQGRLSLGRTLAVTRLAVYPAVPEGATVCYHVDCQLSNISLNRKGSPS